ncbi:hypothetical protein GCM10009836_04340 [Pseudonocardia ailaonensis]|uniref:Uncharacterized protein n=1 Tax=Pseudonocardia ailaonensis TaxID=367279 RepID=A0ABN2MJT8_9PSEU
MESTPIFTELIDQFTANGVSIDQPESHDGLTPTGPAAIGNDL